MKKALAISFLLILATQSHGMVKSRFPIPPSLSKHVNPILATQQTIDDNVNSEISKSPTKVPSTENSTTIDYKSLINDIKKIDLKNINLKETADGIEIASADWNNFLIDKAVKDDGLFINSLPNSKSFLRSNTTPELKKNEQSLIETNPFGLLRAMETFIFGSDNFQQLEKSFDMFCANKNYLSGFSINSKRLDDTLILTEINPINSSICFHGNNIPHDYRIITTLTVIDKCINTVFVKSDLELYLYYLNKQIFYSLMYVLGFPNSETTISERQPRTSYYTNFYCREQDSPVMFL